jgi:hypothetical protein
LEELFEKDTEDYSVPWGISLTRFVACFVLHCIFSEEIASSLALMKFACLNKDCFDKPVHAFVAASVQAVCVWMIEVVNVWNLL